jgi:hypothetical protein
MVKVRVRNVPSTQRANNPTQPHVTHVESVKSLTEAVLNVQSAMQEKLVLERTVYASPVPSLDSVLAKWMAKIQNPVYVLLARRVTTKTKRDKQVVFRAFQASTRMTKDRHRANYAQPMKRAKTLVVQNVILVELAKSQTKVVLNVQSVMREKLVRHVLLASKVSIEPLPWMLIVVHCVALECTKATKDKQVAFHAFQVSTRTKKAKQIANRVLRIPFQREKQETQPVMFAPLVALLVQEVSSVLLALQVNTLKRPLTHVSRVQQVTCQQHRTVKCVTRVVLASKEKAVKVETPPARPATWDDIKLCLVSVKIAGQGSTRVTKV